MERKDIPTDSRVEDFSLVLGGPLYQLWRRSRLVGPSLELLRRRIVAITLLAWLPLVALAFFSGNALKGIAVPFLYDLDTQVKFLVAIPLLVGAEIYSHQRVRAMVSQFLVRGIVTPEMEERYLAIARSTMRLRNSIAAEILIIVLVYSLGHWLWAHQTAMTVATWYASPDASGLNLTPAGWWYVFVSIPIFQFLLLRWYFRVALWIRFLWKVSRLKLKFIPMHPDGSGGLGFLSLNAYAFGPFLMAHTVVVAGVIANRIWHEAASLPQFKFEIAGIVFFLLLLAFLPLTAFSGGLLRAKLLGLGEFGRFSQLYVSGFDAKWFRGGAPAEEPLVGSADIQSLADLANSYEVVQKMRAVPFSREGVIRLALMLAIPFLPLIPTILPVEQMFSTIVKFIL